MKKLNLTAQIKRTAFIVVLLGAYMLAMQLLTGSSCTLRSSFGLPCPGCGMTRAYASLFSLDICGAFVWHPMFWAGPVVIAAWVYKEYIKIKYPGRRVRFFEPLVGIIGSLLILTFAVRAVFLFPHSEPFTLNADALFPKMFRIFITFFETLL